MSFEKPRSSLHRISLALPPRLSQRQQHWGSSVLCKIVHTRSLPVSYHEHILTPIHSQSGHFGRLTSIPTSRRSHQLEQTTQPNEARCKQVFK
jgi:hypothetical protein